MDLKLVLVLLSACVCLGLARPQHGPHYGHGDYFQYLNVPSPYNFEWGYRKGVDPHHVRQEYLKQDGHTFKAKVTWHDAYGGQGQHFWDYNHGPTYPHHGH